MATDLLFVVMAKLPEPGRVKTRLGRPGAFSPEETARIATALGRCVVERLARRGEVVVAVTPDGTGSRLAGIYGRPDLRVVDQGPGDLGARLDRVWAAVRPVGPLAFLGVDSPDVPDDALDAIATSLEDADAAVGPTGDGGYWTLAANRHQPALLAEIDWGTGSVYHQTSLRAAAAGLKLTSLPRWHDVDEPADLEALRRRLATVGHLPGDDCTPLGRLRHRLDEICGR